MSDQPENICPEDNIGTDEAMVKKREEEEGKKREEERKNEREAIENNIKEKYDVVLKEQDNKVQTLEKDLDMAKKNADEQRRKQQEAIKILHLQLKEAEKERKQQENAMEKREEAMRQEMERKDKRNAEAIRALQKNMEESNRRLEQEIQRIKDAEEERLRTEENKKIEEAERAKREADVAKAEAQRAEKDKKEEELRKLQCMPYITRLEGGLYPGRQIYICGTPFSTAPPSRFFFDLAVGPLIGNDIGFHFSARFNEGRVRNQTIRNNRVNLDWQNEERWQPNFPFKPQVRVSIRLLVEDARIRVFVDGNHFVDFEHRMWPISNMNYLHIKGNIILEKVDTNYPSN